MFHVNITRGFHRGKEVSGMFTLVKPFVDKGGGAGEIKVSDVNNLVPWKQTNPIRVKLNEGDYTILGEDGAEVPEHLIVEAPERGAAAGGYQVSTNYEQAFVAAETEEEAMERIASTFLMLDRITDACANDLIRGLVVSGPPGVGKSYGVEQQLIKTNMFRTLGGHKPHYDIISGGISPIGLYQKLYAGKERGFVSVYDDCDTVLFDEECLSLLKAALNSGDRRRICWNKESRTLKNEDIPEWFNFEGSIIFLSNVDFEASIERNSRISAHLAAIMSRCHYLDLEIGSQRDKLLRIKQILRDGMLSPYEFSIGQEEEIMNFILQNADHLRELSLRMVKKIADFVRVSPTDWMDMAVATCLQRDAKFRFLLEKRKALEAAKQGVVLQIGDE
jgi:hypothetical protein